MQKQSTDKLKLWLKRALWLVPIAYAANFFYAVISDQTGGTFGDTFGAANALFSGTALLMLVLAIILQREELEIVKNERDDTRKLLEGQEQTNVMQKQALDRQIYEQTFGGVLSAALQERRRLIVRPLIGTQHQTSEYMNSGRMASELLASLTLETDPQKK